MPDKTESGKKESVKKASVKDNLRTEIIKPSHASIVMKQAAIVSRAREIEDKLWGDVDNVVDPHYDPGDLALIPENSNILPQCIDVMSVNVDSFGHTFKLRDPRLKSNEDLKDDVEKERRALKTFFDYVAYPLSFIQLRLALRIDKYSTGNAFWEMIDTREQELKGINSLPAHTIRLVKKDTEATLYNPPVVVVDEEGIPQIEKPSMMRRFRRFVQLNERGEKIWFKEWGDPRMMNWRTGKFEDVEEKDRATSILHFRRHSARTPYGVPNWIGNLFSVLGSRSTEEINFNSFTNNMIPAMALLVSGGAVTKGTIERIQEYLEDVVAGSANYSEILLIEAEGPEDMIHTQGTVRVDIKPLIDMQRDDEMFVKYDSNNRTKIRTSFRFSSIFMGNDEGFNRATSQTARRLGEEQVFRPERNDFDWIITNLVLPYLGARFHRMESRGPVVVDPEIMARSLTAAEKGGGLTPAIAREALEDTLGRDLPEVNSDKIDPDKPMSLQTAEAAKVQTPEGGQGAVKTPTMKSANAVKFFTDLLEFRDSVKDGLESLEDLEEAKQKFEDHEHEHDHE